MIGNTPTTEEIVKHVSASFDSVNLIINKISEPKTELTKNVVLNNYIHLQTMLLENWFVDNITTQQYETINDCITSGITYCH